MCLGLLYIFSGFCLWLSYLLYNVRKKSEIDCLSFHYLTWFLSVREVEILPKAYVCLNCHLFETLFFLLFSPLYHFFPSDDYEKCE